MSVLCASTVPGDMAAPLAPRSVARVADGILDHRRLDLAVNFMERFRQAAQLWALKRHLFLPLDQSRAER
jgi:hypothetical protein